MALIIGRPGVAKQQPNYGDYPPASGYPGYPPSTGYQGGAPYQQ